jgi:hypothetical protein
MVERFGTRALRTSCRQPLHAVVADDPGRADRGDAVARRVLPGLRHEPGDRSSKGRPPSPRIGRNPRARAAVFMVPGIGAHAEDPRIACAASRGKGSRVEPVSRRLDRVGVRARWTGEVRLRGPPLMSCSVLDRPNVLSQNWKVDPIKPQNPSHARGSALARRSVSMAPAALVAPRAMSRAPKTRIAV